MSRIKELLVVTEEDRERARKLYNKTEEDIQVDVQIILEWLKKQPQLPKDHDIVRLENSLLRNKFRVEKTKLKQDRYYTYRGLYSDFFMNLDPECESISTLRSALQWVPMPKLSPSGERIIATRFAENCGELFNTKDFFTVTLMVLDLQLSHDYAMADRYVVDLSNFNLKMLKKIDINSTTKGLFLYQQAFSGRISGIDYFNLPLAADIFFTFVRQLLGAKLFSKIKIHKTIESLHEDISKSYLPQEFGGELESMQVLHEKWGDELVCQKEFLLQNSRRVSNEKLRIGKPVHNELFGVDGTFKKLNLD